MSGPDRKGEEGLWREDQGIRGQGVKDRFSEVPSAWVMIREEG